MYGPLNFDFNPIYMHPMILTRTVRPGKSIRPDQEQSEHTENWKLKTKRRKLAMYIQWKLLKTSWANFYPESSMDGFPSRSQGSRWDSYKIQIEMWKSCLTLLMHFSPMQLDSGGWVGWSLIGCVNTGRLTGGGGAGVPQVRDTRLNPGQKW